MTNLELNPISYVISGDHFKLFQRPKITDNQVLETNLPGFPIWQNGNSFCKNREIFERFLENKIELIPMFPLI